MNISNDKIMERNFQSFSLVMESLKKFIPAADENISVDQYERVIFKQDFEITQSLIPYFKSDWADYLLYQKYFFLFKKFYCTEWYNKGLKAYNSNDFNLLNILDSNMSLISK